LSRLLGSSFGKSLIALRDNESLAVSRGINRVRQQLLAFVVSGAIAGFTGALYVSFFRVADETLFSFGFVTFGLSMMFLGGIGHIWGPVIGAVVIAYVDRQLTDLGSYSAIIIGVGTVLVLIFLPKGIAGVLQEGFAALFQKRRSVAKNEDGEEYAGPTAGRKPNRCQLSRIAPARALAKPSWTPSTRWLRASSSRCRRPSRSPA
jgi:branched-chain amino acid transport system permease protein